MTRRRGVTAATDVDLTMIDLTDNGELDPPSLECRVPGCRYNSLFEDRDQRDRLGDYRRSVGDWVVFAEKHLDTHREP